MNVEMMFVLLAVGVVFGTIGAMVGGKKGNGGAGFALGFLLGPLGILIAVLLPGSAPANSKACKHCKKMVDVAARRCCHCGGTMVKKSFQPKGDPVEEWERQQQAREKFPPSR